MGELEVGDWFGKAIVDAGTTMLTEPFVHDFVRANIWHLRGRDADLLVDTGMGIRPLAPEIDTPAGKPLIVVATHIHLDHVGSLHEFPLRMGPKMSAAQFDGMDDAVTYAYMFHNLDGAVSKLPAPDWKYRSWPSIKHEKASAPWLQFTVASISDTGNGITPRLSRCFR